MKEKVPGIIGGMGPEATVDLMQRIIAKTPAADDADHIRCLVDNNPKIPSRMRAILDGDGENPGPCMAEVGANLEKWGADFLVIPCNTAHHYYDDVARAVSIPVVDLIDLVVEHVADTNPGLKKVGVLGSMTIVKTGQYTSRFKTRHIEAVYPDEDQQAKLFEIIKRVKRGENGDEVRQDFAEIGEHLAAKGASLAILGCTELGIIAEKLTIDYLDAADLLATEIVDVVKKGKEPHVGPSTS